MSIDTNMEIPRLMRDLWELKAFLDERPELHHRAVRWGTTVTLSFNTDEADQFTTAVRSLKAGAPIGSIRKHIPDDDNGWTTVTWHAKNRQCRVELEIPKKGTCVAKVVGTKTVKVADPDAPKITKTVDVVEWDCAPVLADVDG